ncbi:hypothetical protein MC885_016150, partial [Smutsia gigantea]
IQVRDPPLGLSPRPRHSPGLLASGPLLFQHLDLLVRDSFHPNQAGQGHLGDIIQVRDADDGSRHLRAYVAEVLSAAPQHAKSRCPGYWSEGRPVARGDRRLLTGQQLAQEIKV